MPWCKISRNEYIKSKLLPGDIVFARTGATTGKTFLINHCPDDSVFASHLIRVRLNNEADPRYINHFFQSSGYWSQITQSARGAAQPGVNATVLKDLRIPLPPLPEQRRIAEVLERGEGLRLTKGSILSNVDILPQAIFSEIFGDPKRILTQLTTNKLGDMLDFLTSGSRGWAEHYSDSGSIFLRIQNVRNDELLLDDVAFVNAPATAEAKRTRVEAGDVLLSITADLGRTAVVPQGLGPAYINQHLVILRSKALQPRYLSAYLASPIGQLQIHGRNKHAVKAGLNFDDIRSISVPTPPPDLQMEFVNQVTEVENLRAIHRASLAQLDALFASLQHRAFRGVL